ncbi:hypothetical protein ES705_26751 [subsurface metagenome]
MSNKQYKAGKTLNDVKIIISEHRDILEKKYKVKEIGIFGSYLRGENKRGSDVDILVEFDEVPDLFKFINLENYLKNILKRKVDLVRREAVRKELEKYILNEVKYL